MLLNQQHLSILVTCIFIFFIIYLVAAVIDICIRLSSVKETEIVIKNYFMLCVVTELNLKLNNYVR